MVIKNRVLLIEHDKNYTEFRVRLDSDTIVKAQSYNSVTLLDLALQSRISLKKSLFTLAYEYVNMTSFRSLVTLEIKFQGTDTFVLFF
jgi:hypothetical protein